MYVFVVALLIGLGIWVLAMVFDRLLTLYRELWPLALVLAGIGVAWLADFNIFVLYDIGVRAEWIGIAVTGLMIAGIAFFWREAIGLVGSLFRKYSDQAETLEREHQLRRVA